MTLFESRDRRTKDAQEVRHLFKRHGENTITVLKNRVDDASISARDRRHWKRILRKARRNHSSFRSDFSSN